MTSSASLEATIPCSSSTLPLPISVAGSGRSRRCSRVPTILAPALVASSFSSSRLSSASNGMASSSAAARGVVAALRACFADGGIGASVRACSRARGDGMPLRPLAHGSASPGALRVGRLRNSTPTRNAFSGSPSARSGAEKICELSGAPSRRFGIAHPCVFVLPAGLVAGAAGAADAGAGA
jgi:hypothetical protein